MENPLQAFGDSLTNTGEAADPLSESWINRYNDYVTGKLFNYGASGNGVLTGLNNAYLNMSQTYNNSNVATLLGYNDYRVAGIKAKDMIINAHRAIIANAFLKTAVPANSATIKGVYDATILTNPLGAKANRINTAGRGVKLLTKGSTISYTFTGDNVVLGFVGTDGVVNDYGIFYVYIDDQLVGRYNSNRYATGITLSTNNHQFGAGAKIFRYLKDEQHTIKVVSQSDKPVLIDYFGTMKDPSIARPVMIGEILKMTPAGYAKPGIDKGSTGIADRINMCLHDLVVRKFKGYPVYWVDTSRYDPALTATTDDIHPPNEGHEQILDSFAEATPVLPDDDNTGWDHTIYTGATLINTGGIWTTSATDGLYGHTGLGDKHLAAGADGKFKVRYMGPQQQLHIVGVNNANAAVGRTGFEFGFYVNGSGNIIRILNGATFDTGIKAIVGNYYYMVFQGTNVKLMTSPNNEYFIDVISYTASRNMSDVYYTVIDMNGVSNKQVDFPMTFNFIA